MMLVSLMMHNSFFQVYIMQNEGWLKLPLFRNTRLIFLVLRRMRLNVSSSLVFGSIIDGVYSELLPVCNYRLNGVSFVFLFFLIIVSVILSCLYCSGVIILYLLFVFRYGFAYWFGAPSMFCSFCWSLMFSLASGCQISSEFVVRVAHLAARLFITDLFETS